MDNKKGITLIALTITIIILLILAGITINLTIGQRGILDRAQEAGKNYQETAMEEDEQLASLLKKTDNIILGINGNGVETIPQEPEIPEAVKGLKVGDYIKYDTGVNSVGENGIIICRVIYPVDSGLGLQIISDKNIKNITLGGSNWGEGKVSYNGAIETLNKEAEKYVNEKYAYDGRCVGSLPIVQNGIFINKNKAAEKTITLPSAWTKPTGWANYETGCYDTDTNYVIDKTALNVEESNIWVTGENYWLASRMFVWDSPTYVTLALRIVTTNGGNGKVNFCGVGSGGGVFRL